MEDDYNTKANGKEVIFNLRQTKLPAQERLYGSVSGQLNFLPFIGLYQTLLKVPGTCFIYLWLFKN